MRRTGRIRHTSYRYERTSVIATYSPNYRTHASALKDVGRSLADIAAFMHEVEVRQGYLPSPDDKRGIERARHLAQMLQELPSTLPNAPSSQVWTLSNRQRTQLTNFIRARSIHR